MNPFTSLLFVMLCLTSTVLGQPRPIAWRFKADSPAPNEVILAITATLRPDWHIYSQNIGQGGPIPTQITFDSATDFVLIGKTQEQGNPFSYHDELYEMDITWYAGSVTFLQKIKLINPVNTIHGKMDYMVCNEHTCLPVQQEFTIAVPLPKAHP